MKDAPPTEIGMDIPLNAHPLLALDKYLYESGISAVTAWRYRRRGWLVTVNIAGRHYVSRQAIADFNKRAQAGEFSKPSRNPGSQKTVT